MSKKCPKCGNVNCTIPKMEHHGEQWLSCLICGQTSRKSRFNDVTLFDRITASLEVLAEKLVYSEWIETFDKSLLVYRSTLFGFQETSNHTSKPSPQRWEL